jgi:uncharacterized membrane-anchored protein
MSKPLRSRVWLAAILVSLLQTGAIGTIIAGRAMHLVQGREILLKVVPADPRDLLRGDYARMNYEVSTVPASLVPSSLNLSAGTPVFVTLERQGQPEEGKWVPQSVTLERPAPAPETGDRIVLRGTVKWGWRGSSIRIVYGIESYFVPENTGGDLEKAAREGTVIAVISVDKSGKAAIKGLVIGGVRVAEPVL